MRAITFLLTFSLVLGVTIGDPTNGLPNAGLFIFDEAPISVDAPTIVASR
jgi:hypothetical protein